ncbi:MAG: hypothetical protein LBP29_01600 [Treponema sp.]|nr:hypothetical protein [Treponema sp.]
MIIGGGRLSRKAVEARRQVQSSYFMANKVLATALLPLIGSFVSAQGGSLNVVKPAIADRDLIITVSELTENAVFYPVDIGGTRLKIIFARWRRG